MRTVLLFSLFLFLVLVRLDAEPVPADPLAFLAAPGKPLHFQFKGEPFMLSEATLTDLDGNRIPLPPVGSGNILELPNGLPVGYYTMKVGDDATFSVLIQEPWCGKPDRFFGVDSYLSWRGIPIPEISAVLELLRRYGISAVRDRFDWGAIQKDHKIYQFRNRYDDIRRLYRRAGIELLDVYHASPGWIRPGLPRFPELLDAASAFWTTLGANWRSCWTAVETWNEPEGGFGGNLPADQMMPGVKAMRYALFHSAPEVRLGAAGFTAISPTGNYHRTAAGNGILDNCDFISFHNYGSAESLVALTREYRDWLRLNGKAGMPLWLTEVSQVAWDNFKTEAEACNVAAGIALQAAAGKAVGIERAFFFALYELQEGNKTFGFFAANRTPRLSFAAFLQSVRRLGNCRFVGKLRLNGGKVRSAAVFSGKAGNIVVLEVAEPGGGFRPSFAVRSGEGMDGRRLPVGKNGEIRLADPVVYLLTDSIPAGLIDTDTPENQLLAEASVPAPARCVPSPLVLFPHPDFAAVGRFSSSGGYAVAAGTPIPVGLDIWNLSGFEQKAELTVATGLRLTKGSAKQSIAVPPNGKLRLDFIVELPEKTAGADLDFRLALENSGLSDRASLAFRPLESNSILTAHVAGSARIEFGGLENWRLRIKDQPWNSRDDLDAAFSLAYTKEALILTVEVRDDVHFCEFPPADMWKGDSLQIGIQAGRPKTIAERARFSEFTCGLTPKGALVSRSKRPVPLAITRNGAVTTYKVTLPAAEVGLKAFRPGDSFRLSLVVNDNDGAGRKGFLHWADGLGVNKNPEEFNTVILK